MRVMLAWVAGQSRKSSVFTAPVRIHQPYVGCRVCRSARGMTFLEVLLAVTLLTLVTAMIMTAVNSMITAQVTQRQRLAAAELANGLILTYMDDKKLLPARSSVVVYGRDRYRWTYEERPVTIVPAREEALAARANSGLSLNRIKSVTFHVWLSEESGGTATLEEAKGSQVHFALARIVDPIALRNPDAIERMLKDPEAYQEFLANFTGVNAGGAPPAAGGANAARNRRPTPPARSPASGAGSGKGGGGSGGGEK
jgi:type II secretory pathway pseudopilin PulG